MEELLWEARRQRDDRAKVSAPHSEHAGKSSSKHVTNSLCFQELERERHAHGVLQFEFKEIKETLKHTEELLTVSYSVHNTHSPRHRVSRLSSYLSCQKLSHGL